ncbi:DUF3014 domain-containing protein [Zhongshania sp.]|uniref:DUF3014 domain-containing protein n=1 Tax=Zhongshania sp. TaxID=1971902 RepID=UPI001B5606B1|nr:DUF3014 domain-containing protein [Zhongshania sp.]MBQ0796152.1 DUF3014 domain-containing protein [Zhongshania sp.]|tara:strand:+ start:2195 stop:2971 length:777 start_codon:yes stop_codon:yes gene_type:complete
MNWKALSAVVVIVAVAGFVWYVLDRSVNSEYNEPVVETVDDAAAKKKVKETLAVESESDYKEKAASAPEPPVAIDGSDEQLRSAAATLSAPLAEWMQPDEQVRKWVSVVDQLATYRFPTKHLPLVYNKEPFLAVKTEKGFQNDPGNFKRWDGLVNTVTAVEPKNLAIYYKKWSPFLEGSYNELGNPQSFDNQLRTMIEHLLMVEPIPEDAALKQPKVLYEYVDPVLENADPLSKWMWRLGPENMKKLQDWLRELESFL